MANRIFTYELIIKEFHLDTFGHVNNAAYPQIYEEARWEFITQNGYGLEKVKTLGQGPVALEIKISFKKELRLRERIVIHSQLLEYNGKIGKMKQWITDSKGDLCSEFEMIFGLFDTRERKLVLPTDDWKNAIT